MKGNDNERKLKRINTDHLKNIKKDIPLIKNLHFSFWQNPQFLRWQLVRLNKVYQGNTENIWEKFWLRFEYKYREYEESVRGWHKTIARYGFDNFYPLPDETFDEWYEKPRSTQGLFETKTVCNPPHEEVVRIDIMPGPDYSVRDKEGKKKSFATGDLELMESPPIPWVVRFPLPLLLSNLPPWPEKGKSIRGRPRDWGSNLLVYELSQTEMKNAEIGRLLFGMDKSRISVSNPKHPILVKIAKIKKSMHKIVSDSFPF